MSEQSLLYTEHEDELRTAVRGVLSDRASWQAVHARIESDALVDADLWRVLARDVGVAGLPVPEKLGGAGATWRETAVVAEELGRTIAPVPYLGSAVLATAALLAAGDTALLPSIAAGEQTATLVVPFSSGPGAVTGMSVAGGKLSGSVTSVADARTANVLLVPAADGLYAVEAAAATVTDVTSFDLTRPLADVTLGGATGELVGSLDAAAAALTAGAAILASEQLGIAEWCLETTITYVQGRYQFGRQIGSFQGLKHRLADVWVSIAQARATARYAAACLASDDADLPVAASLAQAFCSGVAVKAAEECVQMHGGIGFTWEHPAHLYLKRAKADSIALGTAEKHRTALAGLVDIRI